jgi:chromosome partitioning related protein ParA
MRVVSVVSTKGGGGKTTVAANIGGLLADSGLRVLLRDLDSQPTLSSYYSLNHKSAAGTFEFNALNLKGLTQIVSTTMVVSLDLIFSNDDQGRLSSLLLHAPDGRLRLRNLLDGFQPRYDLLLINIQGARSVLLEMAILASDLVLSTMFAARKLQRGTLRLLLNQVNSILVDARMIIRGLRETFAGTTNISVLDTVVPARVAYLNAASLGLPAHRIETRLSRERRSPSALESMQALANELFPEWREAISRMGRCAEAR